MHKLVKISFYLAWCFSLSSLSYASDDFTQIVNRGRRWDPYNPKVRSGGHFVGGVQLGTNADHTLYDSELLFLRYYHSKSVQFYLLVPDLKSDWLSLGTEYKISHSDWVGFEIQPKFPDFRFYYRGLSEHSKTSKTYYEISAKKIEDGLVTQVHLGHYSRPFFSSKNSFIDVRAAYELADTDTADTNTFGLIGGIGHGWANFTGKRGLELYGSLGLEYTLQNVSTADESSTDLAPRIMVGILYHQSQKRFRKE